MIHVHFSSNSLNCMIHVKSYRIRDNDLFPLYMLSFVVLQIGSETIYAR